MTPEQLELAIDRTRHERYRWLTSDDNPDVAKREAYRAAVVELADGPWPRPAVETPAGFPPLADQVAGLVGTLAAWARSGFSLADGAERRRRLATCLRCPLLDRPSGRCTACGCSTALKPWIASASCPRGRWEAPPPA